MTYYITFACTNRVEGFVILYMLLFVPTTQALTPADRQTISSDRPDGGQIRPSGKRFHLIDANVPAERRAVKLCC